MNTVPLGELIHPAKVARVGSGDYPVLSMTMHEGLVDQRAKFKKRVASDDLSDYKLIERGQLVVGFPIDEGVLDFQTLYDLAIASPAYGVWDLADEGSIHRAYLKRFLRSHRAISYYSAKLRSSTARRRSLPRDAFLALPVPLPPLDEQRRIAAILDQADGIRAKRRQVLAHLDDLIQSIFHDMFGDADSATYVPLAELADVSSGITKGRRTAEPTSAVPYLAVANVHAGSLKLDQVKTIEATSAEMQRYALQDGDIVLTEGGDPDKLGRGTVWRGELTLCLHQNHIFRVRMSRDAVLPDYVAGYMASPPARAYFLRAAKQTTGIASINMTQLRGLPVAVPSFQSQQAFVDRLHAVSSQRDAVRRAQGADNALFASLQSRAFRGEL